MILTYIVLSLISIFFVINIITYLLLFCIAYKVRRKAEKYLKDKNLGVVNKKIDKLIK